MSADLKTRVIFGACLLLLLASTAVNVLQAQRIQLLLDGTNAVASNVGDVAVPVSGFSRSQEAITVTFNDPLPTVLYYFSTTCGWCDKNWDNIKALNASAAGRYRLVGLTADRGLESYASRHGLDFEIVEGISENIRTAYSFYGTPHTVVVDGEGRITHDWRGAFNPRIERQIGDLFAINLPGLSTSTDGRD
jgi:peroxiredoxin